MTIKLLTEHHFEFLSLKGGCIGLSESIHVKMPHCWKSHVVSYIVIYVVDPLVRVGRGKLFCVESLFCNDVLSVLSSFAIC